MANKRNKKSKKNKNKSAKATIKNQQSLFSSRNTMIAVFAGGLALIVLVVVVMLLVFNESAQDNDRELVTTLTGNIFLVSKPDRQSERRLGEIVENATDLVLSYFRETEGLDLGLYEAQVQKVARTRVLLFDDAVDISRNQLELDFKHETVGDDYGSYEALFLRKSYFDNLYRQSRPDYRTVLMNLVTDTTLKAISYNEYKKSNGFNALGTLDSGLRTTPSYHSGLIHT